MLIALRQKSWVAITGAASAPVMYVKQSHWVCSKLSHKAALHSELGFVENVSRERVQFILRWPSRCSGSGGVKTITGPIPVRKTRKLNAYCHVGKLDGCNMRDIARSCDCKHSAEGDGEGRSSC